MAEGCGHVRQRRKYPKVPGVSGLLWARQRSLAGSATGLAGGRTGIGGVVTAGQKEPGLSARLKSPVPGPSPGDRNGIPNSQASF
jgi:hypothetical protein